MKWQKFKTHKSILPHSQIQTIFLSYHIEDWSCIDPLKSYFQIHRGIQGMSKDLLVDQVCVSLVLIYLSQQQKLKSLVKILTQVVLQLFKSEIFTKLKITLSWWCSSLDDLFPSVFSWTVRRFGLYRCLQQIRNRNDEECWHHPGVRSNQCQQ